MRHSQRYFFFLKALLWSGLALLYPLSLGQAEERLELALPVDCQLGTECFLQNYADLDPNKGIIDPYCGKAAYDGHKGTDFRLKTLKDIERNVSVLAAAEGTIIAVRDGMPDRIIRTESDRAAVKNKECGNGVLLRHANGYETQYCHMKSGSIRVKKGDEIKTGDVLGSIGTSGHSEFPHLHLSLRKDGQWIDPITGTPPQGKCGLNHAETTLFQQDVFDSFPDTPTAILDIGISGQRPEHDRFVQGHLPALLSASSEVIIGWVWAININKGDTIRIVLIGPDGEITDHISTPLDRHKASYSQYAGKRRVPEKGTYAIKAEILRNGVAIETQSKRIIID